MIMLNSGDKLVLTSIEEFLIKMDYSEGM